MISSCYFSYSIICVFVSLELTCHERISMFCCFFLSVEQAYINQRKLETEAKQLQAQAGTTCIADSVKIMVLF